MPKNICENLLDTSQALIDHSGFRYHYSKLRPFLECIVKLESSRIGLLAETYYDDNRRSGYTIVNAIFRLEEPDIEFSMYCDQRNTARISNDDITAKLLLGALRKAQEFPVSQFDLAVYPKQDLSRVTNPRSTKINLVDCH